MTYFELMVDPMTEEQKDKFLAIIKATLDEMGLGVGGICTDLPEMAPIPDGGHPAGVDDVLRPLEPSGEVCSQGYPLDENVFP